MIKRNPSGLDGRTLVFIDLIVKGMPAGRAYEKAGWKSRGVVASAAACRKLKDVSVQKELQRRRAKVQERADVTGERIMREYARVAFSDIRGVLSFGPDGVMIKNSDDLDDNAAATVAEVSESGEESMHLRVKLHDKMRALDSLAKITGMFKDKETSTRLEQIKALAEELGVGVHDLPEEIR